jgi:hypothetical protein
MNPRGRQFALAGTLSGWARLDPPTARQRAALRRAYRGLEPRAYSSYGTRRWAAPLPWVTVIVKDPFAMLSIQPVAGVTGALPVLVFRHPAAVLNSYRRMGWRPDMAETARVAAQLGLPGPDASDDIAAMAWFWSFCHRVALDDLARLGRGVVVSHAEVAEGGEPAARRLLTSCGLRWSARVEQQLAVPKNAPARTSVERPLLHDFDRPPAQVATAWRTALPAADVARIEDLTATERGALEAVRAHLVNG